MKTIIAFSIVAMLYSCNTCEVKTEPVIDSTNVFNDSSVIKTDTTAIVDTVTKK